jgi:lipopolysaccharide transport system ATP-binding protein
MAEDVLISCENVGKKFCRDLKKSLWYGVKDAAWDLFGGGKTRSSSSSAIRSNYKQTTHECPPLRLGEFWANRDISFELKRGECLGLIGRNGAGKTTLLKMLNGLIKPDHGQIQMRGRIGALIALGAGFNPILTGRENISINAAVLGLSTRDINDRMEEIVEFSELGQFIDTPVRNYSSGMQVRLGFSAATVLDPDILILDEVLAVGDAAFRSKCYRRMDELRSRSAVVFVSHDMPSVARICDSVLLLRSGEIAYNGIPGMGIRKYNDQNYTENPKGGTVICFPPISSIDVTDLPELIPFNKSFNGEVVIDSDDNVERFGLLIHVKDASDQYLASFVMAPQESTLQLTRGSNRFHLHFGCMPLKPGKYRLSITVTDKIGGLLAVWLNGREFETTGGSDGCVAACQLDICVTPATEHILPSH